MFKNPRRLFYLLILLTGLLVIIDLPSELPVKFAVGNVSVDRVIRPPHISFNAFGLRINTALTTKLGLDLAGGSHVVLEADMSQVDEGDRLDALESAREIIERRVNFFGLTEPTVQTAQAGDIYRIIVELPGVSDTNEAVNTIGQTAHLEFREFLDLPEEDEETSATDAAQIIASMQPVGLSGKDLKRAQVVFSPETGEPEVSIEFTQEGAQMFEEITERLIGKPLAIVLDDMIVSAPVVNQKITGGSAVISGSFDQESARALTLQLNAGALPVPVEVVEQRFIGPTLGQESINKSIQAGIVGLVMVAVYMVLNYGVLGVIANLGLILYGLITFALFRLIPVTLTLPGIAGFILSVGMAVDSNILIFERFKEEKRRGKPWKMAMELGFGKAWDSIRDANFTTILTSLILYNPGNWQFLPSSGMVRGFAATLFIGVVVGLFTGIIVTRTLIRVLYSEKSERKKG